MACILNKAFDQVRHFFSCSTQLMKFKLLINTVINTEIAKINGIFKFKSQKLVIYTVNERHFNIF